VTLVRECKVVECLLAFITRFAPLILRVASPFDVEEKITALDCNGSKDRPHLFYFSDCSVRLFF